MSESPARRCDSCAAELPASARFCSACGAVVVAEDQPTLSSPQPAARAPGSRQPSSHGSAGRSSEGESRFETGAILAGRYRIVALLGKGGMGEVYRADDLTLGQPVALKFLPASASSEDRLARFRNEVRIARRISHRNVCRVHDIGEADSRHFLTMEYVEGEDLASLLKRIGRLPEDKAVEVARGLCAGLAAAHEKGVIHRDLKPANVMLDRQGQVVITDFGLAAFADQVSSDDARSGTPRYMAPEQLAGGEVTAKSDLYALGLVLHEIFTGRRAHESGTIARAARARSDSGLTTPSSVVKDLDPAVERTILWCLEREPERRPRSALAVSAALPGGDPLAAAIEAGETPSPELVAGAGATTGLRPAKALLRLLAVVLGLAASLALGIRSSGFDRIGVGSPEALAQEAREILARLGYPEPPVDSAHGYGLEAAAIRYFEEKEKPRDWNAQLRGEPPLVFYWYRTSPQGMLQLEVEGDLLTPGVVDIWKPPATLSGMVNVGLDARGRLNFLQVLPPEVALSPERPLTPDWDLLFAAAGLERARFQPAEPSWTSLAASDVRVAWTGRWPGTDRPLRIEAAGFHGKPVYFTLVSPWTLPYRTHPDIRTPGEKASGLVGVTLVLLMLGAAILLARRNYVSGRGDRRGALRLAAFVFVLHVALWACRAHHLASLGEFGQLVLAIANSVFAAGLVWLLYLSLEPYVRKHWPQTLISWSRLLAGRLRDPLVGRDLLTGVMLGVLWALIYFVFLLGILRFGAAPQFGSMEYLEGGRWVVGAWLGYLIRSIRSTLVFFMALFLLRVLLRRAWLAAVAFVLVFSAQPLLASRYLALEGPVQLAVYSIAAVAVVRYGLVALAAGILTVNLLLTVPLTASPGNWHAGSMVFVFLSVLALAVFGFYTSLAGRSLLRDELFD